MLSSQTSDQSVDMYSKRTERLIDLIQKDYPQTDGIIILFAGFEDDKRVFRQESSFYYLSGVEEPGVVLVVDLNNSRELYAPNCLEMREQWVASKQQLSKKELAKCGISKINMLGSKCPGYQFYPYFSKDLYKDFIALVQKLVGQNKKIFTLYPDTQDQFVEQRLILKRLEEFVPGISEHFVDISPQIAQLRRAKDMYEVEQLYKAVDITHMAHEAAAQAIQEGVAECEVQASLEYIMTSSCARPSFPSIVASGKNGTVLHYTLNSGTLRDGDLVVVDIGAEYNNYCADLTRTYPVSGKFTSRQKELYSIVLQTQEYIASRAKPGLWLSNKQEPEKSLNHMARKFLADKGYDKYFPHGIGHFLGLDVHDVGDYLQPLAAGDVITIEPGIYIPEEGIGIRIEDNYWVVEDGVVCLSEQLPKEIEEIEAFVQRSWDSDHSGESEPAFVSHDDDLQTEH